MSCGRTPSRYSRAVPRSLGIVGMEAAIRDLQRGSRQHERQQREDVRQALPRAILQKLVHERALRRRRRCRAADGSPTPGGRRRPHGARRRRRARDRCGCAGSSRGWRPAIARTGSAPRSAGPRDRAAGRRRRAARRTPRTRAPAGAATANGWLGSSSASTSSPTRSSATFRSARTASSATGSQASSGMTWGMSAAGSPSRRAGPGARASRLRDCSATISRSSGSSTGGTPWSPRPQVACRWPAVACRWPARESARCAVVRIMTVRVVMSSTSDSSSSTARSSRLRSSVWMYPRLSRCATATATAEHAMAAHDRATYCCAPAAGSAVGSVRHRPRRRGDRSRRR